MFIKKALVTLLSSAILATTVVSGVVTTPTVAYAKETNTIKITEDDCIDMWAKGYYVANTDKDNIFQAFDNDNNVYTENGEAVYFLGINEYGDLLYPLSGSAVIETDERRYTVSYDGTSYEVTDVVSLEAEAKENKKAEEKAKINKWISDMVVCKHQSAGNVTLSASEKKGTLKITSANINMKTATKIHLMLKTKQMLTFKVKASKKTKALNMLEKLQSMVGHVNTYGVMFWIDSQGGFGTDGEGLPYVSTFVKSGRYLLDNSDDDWLPSKKWLNPQKSGSFYVFKISKEVCKNYNYLVKAYDNAFKRAKNSGFTFTKGTHLCDCSDIVKVRVISELMRHIISPISKKRPPAKDMFKIFKLLAGDIKYTDSANFVTCANYINSAVGVFSYILTPSEIRGAEPDPSDLLFKVKDSKGKSVTVHMIRGEIKYISRETNDIDAICAILYGVNYDLID